MLAGIDPSEEIITAIEIRGRKENRLTISLDDMIARWGTRTILDAYYSELLKENPNKDNVVGVCILAGALGYYLSKQAQ